MSTTGDGTNSVSSASTGVCTVDPDGLTVHYVGVGTCTLTAHVSAGTNFAAADGTAQSFTVSVQSQTISFTSTAPARASVGQSYTPTATGGGSGKPVTFSIDASSVGICNLTGSTVTFTATGQCVIDANQAGDATYLAAPQAQQTIAVSKGSQTITFTSTPPRHATVGDTYAASATGGASSNPVTFSIDAASTSGCTVKPRAAS